MAYQNFYFYFSCFLVCEYVCMCIRLYMHIHTNMCIHIHHIDINPFICLSYFYLPTIYICNHQNHCFTLIYPIPNQHHSILRFLHSHTCNFLLQPCENPGWFSFDVLSVAHSIGHNQSPGSARIYSPAGKQSLPSWCSMLSLCADASSSGVLPSTLGPSTFHYAPSLLYQIVFRKEEGKQKQKLIH